MQISKEAIGVISEEFKKLGVEHLLLGATARDLIAEKFEMKQPPRATADVDFAILVESWEQVEAITNVLLKNEYIEKRKNGSQVRFYYKATPFDVVPFGKIEKDKTVSWPPFYDTVMTVLGYSEALTHAIDLEINGIIVKVISIEMLIALKFIAWGENRSRAKDLTDICYLLINYETVEPRVYDAVIDYHADAFESLNHDPALAPPLYVGLKIKKIVETVTATRLVNILNDQVIRIQMAAVMVPGIDLDGEEQTRQQKHMLGQLNAILAGLNS